MKIISLLALLSIVTISCGKKESPVSGEPHQEAIEKSLDIFDIGKVLLPAKADSRFFKELNKCAFQKDGDDCTPGKTPLLALKEETINADFILEHTLVSHKFLADNFKEFLQNANNAYLLSFFSSVSGIVITDEISTSFYYTPTGMIYINANFLWKTQLEKGQLKFKKDGRFSRDPRKNIFTQIDYIKDNEISYPLLQKVERSISDLSINLKRLFFHELTHAIDVYPVNEQAGLDKNKTYFELRTERKKEEKLVSDKLGYANSSLVWEYANFVIYGDLVNPNSHEFTREDFVTEFAPDDGIVFYSYATKREHLAMLMESYMLLFTDGTQTCVSGIYKQDSESNSELFWFQKNRILQANILEKAKLGIMLLLTGEQSDNLTSLDTSFKLRTELDPVKGSYDSCRI